MFHVIRQTLRSAYLSMMGTFANLQLVFILSVVIELRMSWNRKLLKSY